MCSTEHFQKVKACTCLIRGHFTALIKLLLFFFKIDKEADIKLYKQHDRLAQQNNTVIHDAHLVQLGWVKVHGHDNEEVNVVQGLIWSISEHTVQRTVQTAKRSGHQTRSCTVDD